MVDLDNTTFEIKKDLLSKFKQVGIEENVWVLIAQRQGKNLEIKDVIRIENTRHRKASFAVNLEEVDRIKITPKDRLILAHSHPKGGVTPSKQDYNGLCYPFICGVVYSPKQNALAFHNEGVKGFKKIKVSDFLDSK